MLNIKNRWIMEIVTIYARMDSYSAADAAARSITVGELMDMLSGSDPDSPVVVCSGGFRSSMYGKLGSGYIDSLGPGE